MPQPEKIAILGGGVSAITAAFYLTEAPDWQEKYDITLYQLGWRIGGKGASGRNAEFGQRIEEHGLHIWFGFYVNAFRAIQKVYEEWQRPPGAPLATWQEAFKPHNFVVLQEKIKQEWRTWPLEFPEIPGNPADGQEVLTLWDLVSKIYFWIKQFIGALHEKAKETKRTAPLADPRDHDGHDWLAHITAELNENAEHWAADFRQHAQSALDKIDGFLAHLKQKQSHEPKHQGALAFLLKLLKHRLRKEFVALLDNNDELRRLFISADLALTTLIGMLEDGVFTHGFNVINNIEFRDWLRKHGANEAFTVDSAPVRVFYDLVFGYEDGEYDQPNVEAGTMLRGMLRVSLDYKGGVMFKMQAGMGDTIFSPYYQVLKRRGVKFKFFHKVEELIPDGHSIGEIQLTEQVQLAAGVSEYDPLVEVRDLPCWPSQPQYAQIDTEQAALLQAHNINLESFWSNWPQVYQAQFDRPLPRKTLVKGQDFDKVIFGISVGALEHLCPKLLAQDPALAACSKNVKTVVTQAYQVWTNKDLTQLGWTDCPNGEEPVLGAFVEPYDTWAAMNQLIDKEQPWAPGIAAKNIAYFCSVQPVNEFPPPSQHDFPAQCSTDAKNNAINNLKQDLHWLWPDVAGEGEFQWSCLLNTDNAEGQARFDQHYWRSNIDPSERYVLSVTGSSQYRLATDGTRFTNLYITGDWIFTGLNAGCVEAATMAGMQTARAICGLPQTIEGETDFRWL